MAPDGRRWLRLVTPSTPRGADGIVATLLSLALVLMAALPAAAVDSDGDGLRDGFESKYGVTSPSDPDSDNDGVIDSAEDNDGDKLGNLGEQRFGTNPRKRDSDGDGIPDGREDKDRDGRSNAREQDQRPLPSGLRPTLARADKDMTKLDVWCSTANKSAKLRRCHFGDRASDTTVVLMGDSHALALVLPFKRTAEAQGWHGLTLIKGACIPLLGAHASIQHDLNGGATCHAWRRAALDWLNTNPPDLIVITQSERYRLVDNKGRTIPVRNRPAIWKESLKRTLSALPEASEVLVLGPVPRNSGNPVGCLKKHKNDISACVSPMIPPAKRSTENALRAAADAKGAQFKTLYGKICSYHPCPLVQGNVLMWRDKSHISATYSGVLTPSVRAILSGALAP